MPVSSLSGGSSRRSTLGSVNSPATFIKPNRSCSGLFSGSRFGFTIVTFGLDFIFALVNVVLRDLFLRSLFLFIASFMCLRTPMIHRPRLEKSQPKERRDTIMREMMKTAKKNTYAPKKLRKLLVNSASSTPTSPPAWICPPLKLTTPDNCRLKMPEKEASRVRAATVLLTGEET